MNHFIINFLFFVFALSSVATAKTHLSIHPDGVGPDHSHYLAVVGSQIKLQCESNASTVISDVLQWMRGDIRVDPVSLSVFVRNDPGNRKTLVIPKLNNDTAGNYRCVYFGDAERHVHIHLIEKINWRLKSDGPGAQIGTPLTIDCGTDGASNVTVKIVDEKGRAIEESPFLENTGVKIYVTGHEVTIANLGRKHRGVKVRCLAVRTVNIGGQNVAIHTDERDLSINVWEAPQFSELEHEGHFYKQLGAKAVLRWNVIASNPSDVNFTLKKDGKIVGTDEGGRREFKTDALENMAQLKIDEVLDEDYGQYTCTAHNGKLSTDQIAFLDRPNPPNQPQVWPIEVNNNSVRWHVEEQTKAGQLPVTYFHISYKPLKRRRAQKQLQETKQNLDASVENGDADDDNGDFWRLRQNVDAAGRKDGGDKIDASGDDEWEELKQNGTSMPVLREKNTENSYDIAGLHPFTLYEFTFVAYNDAGSSDPVTTKQETVNEWVPSEDQRNAQQQKGQSEDNATSSASVSIYIGFGLATFLTLSCIVALAVCFIDFGGENVPPAHTKPSTAAAVPLTSLP